MITYPFTYILQHSSYQLLSVKNTVQSESTNVMSPCTHYIYTLNWANFFLFFIAHYRTAVVNCHGYRKNVPSNMSSNLTKYILGGPKIIKIGILSRAPYEILYSSHHSNTAQISPFVFSEIYQSS